MCPMHLGSEQGCLPSHVQVRRLCSNELRHYLNGSAQERRTDKLCLIHNCIPKSKEPFICIISPFTS